MVAYRTVIFDCDSTLSAIEGIDELAGPYRAQSTRLTEEAMQGAVPLEQVYGRRLALIRPDRKALERVGQLYIDRLVPGAARTVRELTAHGVMVQILSGGLLPAVRALGRHLDLADEQVAAVDIRFDAAGAYAGFDESSPLARSGGKRQWIEGQAGRFPRPILLVGDGATDLEARPAVDCFVAFTGVTHRAAVASAADHVIAGPSLEPLLDLVLGR